MKKSIKILGFTVIFAVLTSVAFYDNANGIGIYFLIMAIWSLITALLYYQKEEREEEEEDGY